MSKIEDFSWVSVNHNGTSVIDWDTWEEYTLRAGERIIDGNVIWSDWKIESKVVRWLVEVMKEGVRDVSTLEQYIIEREEEDTI